MGSEDTAHWQFSVEGARYIEKSAIPCQEGNLRRFSRENPCRHQMGTQTPGPAGLSAYISCREKDVSVLVENLAAAYA